MALTLPVDIFVVGVWRKQYRGYVIPEDVRAVVDDVLRHRIGITYEAEAENVTSEDLIHRIIDVIEVP